MVPDFSFHICSQDFVPSCILHLAAKNGIYITLVKDVRDAFEGNDLVKIDCEGLNPSDFKKIGAKLRVRFIHMIF